MFQWVKNNMLAKIQVEKFISSQYVKLIIELEKMLRSDLSKDQILAEIMKIKDEIIKKYHLTDKDIITWK